MNSKIKQKGFIQIPLLIGIIIAVVVVSGATAGIVLHKQGKLAPLLANVSQVSKGTEPIVTEPEQVKPEEISQQEPEPEVIERIVYKDDPILKATIQALEKQIQVLLNRSPEVKEIIKEVPVEKIVYREVECPPCNCPTTTPVASNISYSKRGDTYTFRASGEGFFFKEIAFCQDDPVSSQLYYSINGGESKYLGSSSGCALPECNNCYKSSTYYYSKPAYLSVRDFAFPKDSELTIYNKSRNYFQIQMIRFQGTETGKIISLP